MKLLACDEGSIACGLAFLEDRVLVDVRLVRVGATAPWAARMRTIARRISTLAHASPDWIPDVVAIEDAVLHRSASAAVTMGKTIGYLARVFTVLYPDARLILVSPSSRRSIYGGGRGRDEQKRRAREVVRKVLRWEDAISEDECDAAVIGLAALRDLEREAAGYRKPPRRRIIRQPRVKAATAQLELGAHG